MSHNKLMYNIKTNENSNRIYMCMEIFDFEIEWNAQKIGRVVAYIYGVKMCMYR